MQTKQCKNCTHFWQHYALSNRRIFRVYCGHCTFTKPKRKRPDHAACEHFEPAPSDEAAFVNKEYLSKELLQYLLQLELLPPIVEDPQRIK